MAFSRFASGPTLPLKLLAVWLAISLATACLPTAVSRQIKDRARSLLAPGQRMAWSALKSLRRWGLVWHARGDNAIEVAALRQRVRQLDELNVALQGRIARHDFSMPTDAEQPPPLLSARIIEARVLGQQAQTFLQRTAIIASQEVPRWTLDSLAIDPGDVLVDQGDNTSLATSCLALAGGRVWGKIVEVGPQTASIRRINSAGYRGLVEIVDGSNHAGRPLAHGVLEGTGDALCRIRRVDARSPVSVGDLVLAAEEQGLTDAPLIYGRITRAELTTGAAHWQVWMEPAIADELPQTLTILQAQVNEERIAHTKYTEHTQR